MFRHQRCRPRKGKSTDTVLERIVSCIEDSVTAHEFTLATLGISVTPQKRVIFGTTLTYILKNGMEKCSKAYT